MFRLDVHTAFKSHVISIVLQPKLLVTDVERAIHHTNGYVYLQTTDVDIYTTITNLYMYVCTRAVMSIRY